MQFVELLAYLQDARIDVPALLTELRRARNLGQVLALAKVTIPSADPLYSQEVLRALQQYQEALEACVAVPVDAPWPVRGGGGGFAAMAMAAMRQVLTEAIARLETPRPQGAWLYWVERRVAVDAWCFDFVHDTDACIPREGVTYSGRLRYFEACRGLRYRIGSYTAWRDRPAYWRALLPDA